MTPCLFCAKEIERLLKIKQAAERLVEATEVRERLARETEELGPMRDYKAWRKEWKHVTEEERGAYFDLRAKTRDYKWKDSSTSNPLSADSNPEPFPRNS